jgi:NAD-dependent DNA ligase
MERCPDCGWPLDGKTCQHCKLENYDNNTYMKFCTPSIIDKTLNTLEGILTGITIDKQLNELEIGELKSWCNSHSILAQKQPYSELFQVIIKSLEDNILTLEEKEDILWLCKRLHSSGLYYDIVTSDLQKLQGIIHGILSDGKITKEELEGLREWLSDNEQLSTYYPYDEIYSLITAALEDGIVSKDEENLLKAFFSQFADIKTEELNITSEIKDCLCKHGICALAPEITIQDHMFCFTGKSTKATRHEIAELIKKNNGNYHNSITKKTNYLIIGSEGNTCWAFSCYGRKVEKAMEMRKNGVNIVLVNEIDFWDSI